ncbi:MAG: DNA circularization N-terminal domain-containing protein [Rhodospirillum sp.]|nr:DNA circularization N-terminal domain-containing protein [Rhodospirillum sp.]MCF8500176.1 DNA circularization N-terminal domain-containing protein [Rhodospirillum sp.]
MSTWKDKVRPKWSLRGVDVWWTENDLTAGRRIVEHKYPRQDVQGTEDMGRAPRRFTLSGELFGDDLFDQQDRLLTAVESKGPAKLVHPYMGEIMVVVGQDGLNLRYSTKDGGLITVRLTCVRYDSTAQSAHPKSSPNTAILTEAEADALRARLDDYIDDNLQLDGVASWVQESAVAAFDTLQALPTWTIARLAAPDLIAAGSRAVANGLGSLVENIDGLAAIPFAQRALTLASNAAAMVPASLVGATANRTLALANTVVLARGLSGLALSAAAQAAARAVPESAQAAEALMGSVSDALTEAMWDADDGVYQAMAKARAAVVTHLTETATALPQRTIWTPTTPTPVMTAAHALYGDSPAMVLRGIEDLTARNGICHPLFPETGEALEVLSHV